MYHYVITITYNLHFEMFSSLRIFIGKAVVTWGDPNSGGDSLDVWDQLSTGVLDLCHTSAAFAARKSDGSVVLRA